MHLLDRMIQEIAASPEWKETGGPCQSYRCECERYSNPCKCERFFVRIGRTHTLCRRCAARYHHSTSSFGRVLKKALNPLG